jgi:Uma2 family endonuclease
LNKEHQAMATVVSLPEQKVILSNVSWETYHRLLVEHDEQGNTRFNYDRGVLEIMVLSAEHERLKHTLATLVELLAGELGIDVDGVGSTTFRREDLARGFEADAAFYAQNAAAVADKTRIDLTEDPPPDLVIEIDVTSPSLDKFPIFATLGVPEVWRCEGARVTIFKLEAGQYVESNTSLMLVGVTSDGLSQLLEASQEMKRTAWLRRVREWAQTQKSKGE